MKKKEIKKTIKKKVNKPVKIIRKKIRKTISKPKNISLKKRIENIEETMEYLVENYKKTIHIVPLYEIIRDELVRIDKKSSILENWITNLEEHIKGWRSGQAFQAFTELKQDLKLVKNNLTNLCVGTEQRLTCMENKIYQKNEEREKDD